MVQYKLTYFDIRGLGEPIRSIFAVGGVEFEDNRVPMGDLWSTIKQKFTWGQLPKLQIIENGDKKVLYQSSAICRYLAKQFNLRGDNDFEAAKMDELVDAFTDLRLGLRQWFLEKDEAKKEEIKKEFFQVKVPQYLVKFEEQIDSNNEKNKDANFLVGKRLSWADIFFAHLFELMQAFEPIVLEKYPTMKKHQQTVFAVPQIKARIEKRPVTQY